MNETATQEIAIEVNGQPRTVPAGLTLDTLLRHLGRDPGAPGVAVAVGDRVVHREAWPATPIEDGARVEIITAFQGG
ncbi:MAG TPA: sulfur carrier protein ThiS [Rubricoccaceae bacterium]|nr:sulfur carrier protein ThiS [Rubricoccaceae bacterium]